MRTIILTLANVLNTVDANLLRTTNLTPFR